MINGKPVYKNKEKAIQPHKTDTFMNINQVTCLLPEVSKSLQRFNKIIKKHNKVLILRPSRFLRQSHFRHFSGIISENTGGIHQGYRKLRHPPPLLQNSSVDVSFRYCAIPG